MSRGELFGISCRGGHDLRGHKLQLRGSAGLKSANRSTPPDFVGSSDINALVINLRSLIMQAIVSRMPPLSKVIQQSSARRIIAPHSDDECPLVSVLLPIYNGEDTLERCLEAIVAQDYPNFEVLIADDRSTDRSASIAADFAQRYPNVSFVLNEVRLGAWLNPCSIAKSARGQFVHYAEQDDVEAPNFLSTLVRVFVKHPEASAVTCTHFVKSHENVPRYEMKYLYDFKSPLIRTYNILTDIGNYGKSDAEIFVTGLVRRDVFVAAIDQIGDNYSSRIYVAYFAMSGPLKFVDEALKTKFKTPRGDVRHGALRKRKTRWYYPFLAGVALFSVTLKNSRASISTKLGMPFVLGLYLVSHYIRLFRRTLMRRRRAIARFILGGGICGAALSNSGVVASSFGL